MREWTLRATISAPLIAVSFAAAIAACDSQQPQGGVFAEDTPPPAATSSGPAADGGGATADAGAAHGDIPTWDDATALGWLTQYCANCHGIGPNGDKALYYSAWPMPATLTRDWLETSEYTSVAYQTILNRTQTNAPPTPSPMPVAAPQSDKDRSDLLAVLDWFQRAVPFSVIDANKIYGNSATSQKDLIVNFSCDKKMSVRRYFASMTMALLDRPPTAAELAFFTDAELDGPVMPSARDRVLYLFDHDWKAEFLNTGLKKFANVVGGAPGIADAYGTTIDGDLRQEFYQLLRPNYDNWAYEDYFKNNVVMVSSNTASLYGCPAPMPGTWGTCILTAPRRTFFTTFGYLVSVPSTFLGANNNYGRVAGMFFTLYGEALLAATSGPTGDQVKPLPDCLESVDTRTFQGAPRGTASVPLSGNVCQSCHIGRGMSAGSVLFRPFSLLGQVFSPDTLGQTGTPDTAAFGRMTGAGTAWSYVASGGTNVAMSDPSGKTLLTSLLASSLNGTAKACVPTGHKDQPFATVTSISDLLDRYLANTTSFSRGFARQANRALFNQKQISLEMGVLVGAAYEANQRRLPDLFRAFLSSESLTCEP